MPAFLRRVCCCTHWGRKCARAPTDSRRCGGDRRPEVVAAMTSSAAPGSPTPPPARRRSRPGRTRTPASVGREEGRRGTVHHQRAEQRHQRDDAGHGAREPAGRQAEPSEHRADRHALRRRRLHLAEKGRVQRVTTWRQTTQPRNASGISTAPTMPWSPIPRLAQAPASGCTVNAREVPMPCAAMPIAAPRCHHARQPTASST